jgi:hypothetical protein
MAKLTTEGRRRLAEAHPELFVIRPTAARPLGGYPVDTAARAKAAHARAVQSAGPGSKLDRRVERKVKEVHPGMAVHYHGVHPCHGGEEHRRLIEAYGDEVGHRNAFGEAFGLEGGGMGLATPFVRAQEDGA